MAIRKKTYDEYDKKLEFICYQLNILYNTIDPLKEEYYKIMSYYRTQLNRKLITQEEYDQRAKMFERGHFHA